MAAEQPLFTAPPSAPPFAKPPTYPNQSLHNYNNNHNAPRNDFIYRPAPAYPPHRRRRSCFCCLCSLLFALIIVVAIAALIFYLVVQPRSPKYRVQDVHISTLTLSNQTSPAGGPYLSSNITFTLFARNPNKKISIYYDEVGVDLSYDGNEIGSASIPPFYQGHKTTTLLPLNMVAHNTPLDADAGSSLRSAIDGASSMFLRARIEGHIRLKIGKFKSRHDKLVVKCDVQLIPPSSTTTQRLLWSKCKLR